MGVKAKLRKNRKNGILQQQKQRIPSPSLVERKRKEILDSQRHLIYMCVFYRHQLSEVVFDDPYIEIISTYRKYGQLGIFLRSNDDKWYFVKAEDLRETQRSCIELLQAVNTDLDYFVTVGYHHHSNVYAVYLTTYEAKMIEDKNC